eukprot:TRINITY_DN2256_c0_g2_i3.p1 TRINITY_DN2256_c0_g2~~TRINITY_DN2256_c0_g2_i3.p1  ORF type:complete len:202 (-),score=24.46 TRINITY_DN2256_c0_g2_i3:214-819(-)
MDKFVVTLCLLLALAASVSASHAEIVKRILAPKDPEYRVVPTENDQLFQSNLGNCTQATCSNHGVCNDYKTFCLCLEDWITYDSTDGMQCNYQQKKQLTAFLLHFFLGGIGGGDWYVGRYGIAGGKLALCVVLCCTPCILRFFGLDGTTEDLREEKTPLACCCFLSVYCIYVAQFVWWMVDCIFFGQNKIADSNGASLKAW